VDLISLNGEIALKSQKLREKAEKWNVVICVIDACGAGHMGLYGYHRKTTPYLDEIAKESLLFSNFQAAASNTSVSMGSFFTGLYPHHHRIYRGHEMLDESITAMGEIMKTAGFRTIGFSGNRLGGSLHGFERGFDRFTEFQDMPTLRGKWNLCQEMIFSWIEKEAKDERFFLFVHYVPPHGPYLPPPPLRGTWSKNLEVLSFYKGDKTLMAVDAGRIKMTESDLLCIRDCYDDNVLYADYLVGSLKEKLEEEGLYENLLFIVVSDHGEAFMEHGRLLHNTTVYEEMVHVPFLIHFPTDEVKPGKVDALAETVDILPTLTDLFGVERELDRVDGVSLLPLITGDAPKIKDYLLTRTVAEPAVWGLRDERYKYIYYTPCLSPPWWRPVKESAELYDLIADPAEKRNILNAKPRVAKRMHNKLMELLSS